MLDNKALANATIVANEVRCDTCFEVRGFATLRARVRNTDMPFHEEPTTLPILPRNPPNMPWGNLAMIKFFKLIILRYMSDKCKTKFNKKEIIDINNLIRSI